MTREAAIQVGVLYGPLVMAGVLTLWLRPQGRLAIGLLFSTVWIAALLPWLDLGARALGMWSYQAVGPGLAGMPLSLYFGWIIAWGWLAPLAIHAAGTRWPLAIVALVSLDLGIMPQLEPVVSLSASWWIADIVLFAILLFPGLLLCRWTHLGTHLQGRVGLLAVCFGGTLLGLPLLATLESSSALAVLGKLAAEPLWIPAAWLFALPGLTAMRDLARGGGGTPVPLDPPVRLVTHGSYGFVANPMQISMTLLLLLEASYLWSAWPLVVAGLGIIYSEGFARWSESRDMDERFGREWQVYRSRVRRWVPRWRPAGPEGCELWIDLDCGPCASLGEWFARRDPVGIRLRNARDWPAEPLQRMTWLDPASGRRESGVSGFAMALQHLALPWALAGLILGTPGLRQLIQCCLDAAGLGPRTCPTNHA